MNVHVKPDAVAEVYASNRFVYFDIETIPCQRPEYAAELAEKVSPPGNIKKPESIAAWLEENREQVEMIEERIKARCVGAALRQNPQMKRALDNFKAVLDLRVNQSDISDAQIKKIIAVIDRAAFDITQLD